jgi:hypothetical protein
MQAVDPLRRHPGRSLHVRDQALESPPTRANSRSPSVAHTLTLRLRRSRDDSVILHTSGASHISLPLEEPLIWLMVSGIFAIRRSSSSQTHPRRTLLSLVNIPIELDGTFSDPFLQVLGGVQSLSSRNSTPKTTMSSSSLLETTFSSHLSCRHVRQVLSSTDPLWSLSEV